MDKEGVERLAAYSLMNTYRRGAQDPKDWIKGVYDSEVSLAFANS